VLASLHAFFATQDTGRRSELAAAVAADPAYAREKLRGWLLSASLHPPLPAGPRELRVEVGHGQSRAVSLRVPKAYTPGRAWPLVYALHPSGGDGPGFLRQVEAWLGPRAEEFVIAAPTGYRQTGLDAPPPFTVDHLAILRAVRRELSIDAARQYAVGYSLGGYAAWAVACLHTDELAGAVSLSSAFAIPPTEDGLWREMLPTLAHLPVLNVWGERDTLDVYSIEGGRLPGIGALNRRLAEWSKGLAPTIENHQVPGRGHRDTGIPLQPFHALLSGRRADPETVDHRFRHLHQGHAYWLEAGAWQGERWAEKLPKVRREKGESGEQALGRELASRLGRLAGRIEGTSLRVETRHVSELTVWLPERLLGKDVRVEVDGRPVHSGRLEPDLLLCLTQVARTGDRDRLRWAGLRVNAEGRAVPVDARTPFPPLLPE
jgi:pimeloyl-ACP methyl ester carboxylesterase